MTKTVFKFLDRWFWYDETWQTHGPYGTYKAAAAAQLEYAKTL